MTAETADPKDRLLDAALPHVAFDGWSEATFRAAAEDAGISMGVAKAACPRGAVDLADQFAHGRQLGRGRLQQAIGLPVVVRNARGRCQCEAETETGQYVLAQVCHFHVTALQADKQKAAAGHLHIAWHAPLIRPGCRR